MADQIRILLADDHPVVRKGLRMAIEEDVGLSVVGEALLPSRSGARPLGVLGARPTLTTARPLVIGPSTRSKHRPRRPNRRVRGPAR